MKIKKILSIFISIVLILNQVTLVRAYDIPTPPPAPTAPPSQTVQSPPPAPTPPPAPSLQDDEPSPTPSPTASPIPSSTQATTLPPTVDEQETNQNTPTNYDSLGGIVDNSNVGDTNLSTGDASNSSTILSTGNDNLNSGLQGSPQGSATISNSENGDSSNNSASVILSSDQTAIQNNSALVSNTLNQTSLTGENSASRNVGTSTIDTGDANTTGTIVNTLNTNALGVSVSEFNVVDNHTGDIVLDFAANCISNCGSLTNTSLSNTSNGDSSTNNINLDTTSASNTFQNNDLTLENNMILVSNTGDNLANSNTKGDSTITTGDANISANILNFGNNNLAGNVIYGVVNIFGDLIGDIILPDNLFSSDCSPACDPNLLATNTVNGDSSTNNINLNLDSNINTFQNNNAEILNDLTIDATTSNNSTSSNTGGDNTIDTGDVNVKAQVVNIANNNISGGNLWLVIINEAGKWVGKILGDTDGTNFAGSSEFQFDLNENGEITATNSQNGDNSNNNINLSSTNTNNTVQTNNAQIVNNVNLTANTGGNSASRNTGGNNTIQTGDVNVVANIVNFVNNNITGGGKLYVTVVNVFGSWMGNFLTPGSKSKENSSSNSTGGSSNNSNDNQNQNNSQSQGSQSQSQPSNSSLQTQSASGPSSNRFNPLALINNNPQTQAEDTLVKGLSEGASEVSVQTSEIAKKALKVNLAWFILVLPLLFIVTFLSRKKIFKV